MPLSDHEQKLLEQIEQALYAEDPKFAATVRKVKKRPRGRRWIALSVFGVLLGLGLVLVGLLSGSTVGETILGIAGFILIVASCAYGSHMLRGGKAEAASAPGPNAAKAREAGGLRGRMEDRLRRRFDEN